MGIGLRGRRAFGNIVRTVAIKENYCPAITTEWVRVVVGCWPHNVDGLIHNDRLATAKTDRLP